MSVTREYESSEFAGDYEEIERAVMESARGRWFLAEFAKRQRAEDTALILDALHRLEATVVVQSAGTSPVMVRPLVSEAFDSPQLTAEALRYYRQDEDLFAPAAGAKPERPSLRVVEAANPRVTIKRTAPEPEAVVAEAPAPEPPKPRIVVVKRASSEHLTIPLENETPENAVA